MFPSAAPTFPADILTRVVGFEAAVAGNPDADPTAHLPPPTHPLYRAVLVEMVRIGLARTPPPDRSRRFADYRSRFPGLLDDPTEFADVWHDDEAGPPTARVGPVAPHPTVNDTPTHDLGPPAAGPHDPSFPDVGTTFLGFRLVGELGRGAFGRVYLAYQGDLGGRPVALKVAPNIVGESRTLAQLQHTNIVPIYSFHRTGPLQAVCMPFFGRTTLAQVLSHLSDRPSLPQSGRELLSTLNRRVAETAPPVGSAAELEASPTPVVAPAALPEPGRTAGGWARLEGLSFVGAVLWLGAQLADGLAHAHARGILHCDLKPANVLLTDDGRPMLLDFNLAEDTKTRPPSERPGVGGTLPYMAPEHIRAFRDRAGAIDERCDVYSLGVILYELLTCRHPFPSHRGTLRDAATAMIADREQGAPRLRTANPAVSPAAEAIVRKCLAPNPADRYQTAEQLRDDLDRQLNHLPLLHAPNPSLAERARKWGRRHPRVASSATVGVAAAVLLAGLGAGAYASIQHERERTRAAEAQAAADADVAADARAADVLTDHRAKFADTRFLLLARDRSAPRVDDGLGRLGGLLGRYGVPDDGGADAAWLDADAVRRLPPPDRDRLRADVGETFYLMAQLDYVRALGATDPGEKAARLGQADRHAAAAARYAGEWLPRAVREQRAVLAELQGDPAAAKRLRAEAAGVAATARDEYLLGVQLAHQHEYRRAAGHLRRATQLDPANFPAWFARGSVHLHLDQPELALMCYGASAALRDDAAPVWRNRGYALARMRLFDQAIEDYDRAAALDPGNPDVYLIRSDAKFALRDFAGAEADLTRALDTGKAPVRAYFLRANVRHGKGDAAGAAADRAAGLALTPTDALSWVGRSEQRAGADPAGALADVEGALKLDPLLLDALQMKAHLLTELRRPADAVAVLDRAVELYPDSAPARAGRGVLLARQGKRDAAVRDARDAALLDTHSPNVYQVACVYALTAKDHPDDRREALALLWAALKTGFGLDLVDTDTDLDPLRPDPEFRRVVENARALQREPRR